MLFSHLIGILTRFLRSRACITALQLDMQGISAYNCGMKAGEWAPQPVALVPRRVVSRLLMAVGGVLFLAGAICMAYLVAHSWLVDQDRYLAIDSTAAMAIGVSGDTLHQASLDQAGPHQPSGTPVPSGLVTDGALRASEPASAAAVRIRIPAIGVDRTIIEVPLTYDSRSKTWTRDYSRLFRSAGKDLVGHWGGSSLPGQPGNTILVGHNYGYGYNGVFLKLAHLKVGQQVEVLDATGRAFAYRVREVTSVPWSKKNQQELTQHLPYLSIEGPERLTLVTCGGSTWAPFPDRVYVVADPAPAATPSPTTSSARSATPPLATSPSGGATPGP
jgi:LPXTG-site transpeptidase (sortase) family protein